MQVIDRAFLLRFFRSAATRLEENRDMLCALDGEVGDGDHGTSMANGFAAVIAAQRDALKAGDLPDAVLRDAASSFLSEVGATVGPLYASAFLQASKAMPADGGLPLGALGSLIAAFAEGIERRGNAKLGDKTMLDAWLPAAHAAKEQEALGADPATVARHAADAAESGARATATMIASRGRAARLKERSLGHPDPGAVSAAMILRSLAEVVGETARPAH